jgi:hypothetical protein
MKHFGVEQWADFSRGIHSQVDVRAAIVQHLDRGCTECIGSFQVWQSVREKAQSEKSYTPSPELVHQVKAMAVLFTPKAAWSSLPELARLVFDSFTQPLTAGVRGTATDARQLLYRAGKVAIDLRVEVKPGEVPVFLFGQVLQEGAVDRGDKLIEVSLLEGNQTLGRTTTNELGEFELHVPVLPGLVLSLHQSSGKDILIPLSALACRGRVTNQDSD